MLLCLLLIGCTKTNIHLYTKYLSESETKNITSTLENNNFNVIENDLPIPKDINESTIIYSPMIEDRAQLASATNLLSELGWLDIKLEAFVRSNHWYSKNSAGLVLLPKNFQNSDWKNTQVLANNYQSNQCSAQIQLRLANNATYTITYAENNKVKKITGTWKISHYPYLELSTNDGALPMYFIANKRVETDIIGTVSIIEISPVQHYHILADCTFIYGLRG